MVYRIFLATALIVSNVALYHLSVSLISLIHGTRRRSYGFARRPGLFRSEKPHAGSRGRSSLAHFRVKGATLKALKKLKVCLQPSAAKEGLPIFHVPCTDLNPSLNFCAKADEGSGHHEHMRGFSNAHSWPPAQQSIKRFAADLDFLFTLPMASELHRLLPGMGPVPGPGASARTGYPSDAPACPPDLDMQRGALRAMYRARFQQASRLSKRGARSAFEDALYSLAPSATALRAQLLARGVMLQAPGGQPGEYAGAAEGALMPSPAMLVAQPPATFPAALSCPPEFWGEDGDEALRAGGKSTSLDFLLDTLMDMSVAALVCSTSSADAAAAGSLTPKGWPTAMRSPSKRCGMHAAQDMATVPSAHIQPLATVQGP